MTSLLHRDDGLVATRTLGETLADLELHVFETFLKSRGRVLDVGCGRGRSCVYLALKGNEVLGIDIDLPTLLKARELNRENSASCEFVRADGRRLCFRDGCFDYVISLASTLSEKYRVWLGKSDRQAIISETLRVAKPKGVVVANFVHRYWSLKGFAGFARHYSTWAIEKLLGRKTELGDYTEEIGGTLIRFHAFTIREARSLFPRKGVRLVVWRRGGGFFSDWFFVVADKTG